MKHLVLTQFGTPSESVALHDDRDPTPGPDDVLVRMEAASVNPSDLLLLRGRYFARPDPPAPVGGEGVGIVVDAGARVDRGLLGKRVIVLPTYTYGTWAEKVVVPQGKVVEVDPDADPLQLAMLPINPATAHVMLNRFVDLQPGDWVGQPGANSAVGRLVITLAQLRGLKTLNVCGATRPPTRCAPPVASMCWSAGRTWLPTSPENSTANSSPWCSTASGPTPRRHWSARCASAAPS